MGTTSAAMRAPKQARSAETLERILDAAEEILIEKSFDDASLHEIASRAGVTIGAIYARFRDKDALLGELERRMHIDFDAFTDDDTAPEHWAGKTFQEALRERHRALVGVYKRHRGVGRALVLRSRVDPALKRRLDRLNARNLPRAAKNFAQWGRITHPEPEKALRFANLAVRSLCREVILFGEGWPDGKGVPESVLVDELTRLFVMYVGVLDRPR
jgi:AcrR family transcriptional regulator